MSDLTVAEAVLDAAQDRASTLEELAVRLWEKDPKRFGLHGFENNHPDPRKVACTIMGSKGLKSRGLLKQNGRLYTITAAGRERLRRPEVEPKPVFNGAAAMKLTRIEKPSSQDLLLQRLLATPAWSCWPAKKEDINFSHAMDFLGVRSDMAGAKALDEQIKELSAALHAARGRETTILPNGRLTTAWEIERLCELHDWLVERFSRHLSLLRGKLATKAEAV